LSNHIFTKNAGGGGIQKESQLATHLALLTRPLLGTGVQKKGNEKGSQRSLLELGVGSCGQQNQMTLPPSRAGDAAALPSRLPASAAALIDFAGHGDGGLAEDVGHLCLAQARSIVLKRQVLFAFIEMEAA